MNLESCTTLFYQATNRRNQHAETSSPREGGKGYGNPLTTTSNRFGGGGSALDRPWFRHPFAHRLDHCDDACAADERVQDRPHLHMRPCFAARCAHIALVKLGGNGIVAHCARRDDLIDDRPDVGGKPPRICLYSRRAALRGLGQFGIAEALPAPLGGG